MSELLSLPTEVLVHIIRFLPAYDKLCVRITCKRLHSIVSDPRVWNSLVWRDCRRSDRECKAFTLALELADQYVRNLVISYRDSNEPFPLSEFPPQVHSCKQLCSLTLIGMPVTPSTLDEMLSQLPSLQSLTIDKNKQLGYGEILSATASTENLERLCVLNYERFRDYDSHQIVDSWRHCGYRPPNLSIYASWPIYCIVKHLTSSDHPAFLSVYHITGSGLVNKYPIIEASLHPRVQAGTCVSKSICSSCPDGSSVVLTKGKLNEYTGATYFYRKGTMLPWHGPTLPCLPASIEYLCLATLNMLSSEDLTLLSESCPNLVCLNINHCKKALLVLQGLADIATNCSRLSCLNIIGITNNEVESVAGLWEVLAGMKKLHHLAVHERLCSPDQAMEAGNGNEAFDEHYKARIRASTSHMSLHTFEVGWSLVGREKIHTLQLDLFVPALRLLQHLRITTSGSLDLIEILPNILSLTRLWISSPETLTLPTDPECYASLRGVGILSCESEFTVQHIRALPKKLAMLMLDVRFSMPNDYLEILRFPCLYGCYLGDTYCDPAAKQVKMEDYGMCGVVSTPNYLTSSVAMLSLWPNLN